MKLPLELIIKIVEDACTRDFGKTARNIGLVSKDLRAIAEPLELRSVAVSGIKQLEGFTARLERARAGTSGGGSEKRPSRKVEVHHPFISELTEEHALALEIPTTGPIIDSEAEMELRGGDDCHMTEEQRLNRVYTELEGQWKELDSSYRTCSREFWSLATALVKNTSPSLKSLSLLASDTWFVDRRPYRRGDQWFHQKVLGCLSGVSFPDLVYLAVDHDADSENKAFRLSWSPFVTPHCPQLRRLYIRSQRVVFGVTNYFMHPLFRDYPSTLRDACLCGGDVFPPALRRLFGHEWDTAAGKRLPGNLRSLVLRLDVLPDFGLEKVSQFHLFNPALKYDTRILKEDIEKVKELQIDGLEVPLPYWHSIDFQPSYPYWTWFPEEGQRHYEPMLKEFRESA